MIKVTALHVYPLKGGRGIEVDRIELDRFGPRNDRRWMVVDPDGSLVTQREFGRLCQVGATPDADSLVLSAPGRSPLPVPRPPAGAPTRRVRVWDDHVGAVDVGDDAAGWISEFLGAPTRLVFCPDDADRRTDPDYDAIGSPVSFADGYPLLVASEASLADLNARLDTPLPMNRFRPNLVVSGVDAFGEDGWRRFEVAGIPFDGVKLCARCPVTTTDQETGQRAQEPLRTMASFRKRNGGVMFGMNAVHRATGPIRVGDVVTVIRSMATGSA